MTIRFDEAWTSAYDVASEIADETCMNVVLVRDLLGRPSIVLDDRDSGVLASDVVTGFTEKLRSACGPFSTQVPITLASELLIPESILTARDLVVGRLRGEGRGAVSRLELGVMGGEWLHPRSSSRSAPENEIDHRVALYGFKGGVGRSTATFMLAQHLASAGRCVVVADLDLESPGVGALLQSDEDLPEHGLVDYLVESGVGNEAWLDLVTRSRTVRTAGNGEVWLAPAGGRPRANYDYLAKLNRAYLDFPAQGPESTGATFATRLAAAVRACEDAVTVRSRKPDVVLLDSRAGIHDIAAIVITQLAGLSLLFAADSAHTWNGYRLLFEQWGRLPDAARIIRERLRMVAAMVPRDRQSEYLESFRDKSQACFAATLYDDVPADGGIDGDDTLFNPPTTDPDAPHSPIPIYFSADLVGLDATARRDWPDIDPTAYQAFTSEAAGLILGGRE